jgi:hypothetical protein
METSGVTGNVGRAPAVVVAGAGVVWPATRVKEARAMRAERAEWAIMAADYRKNGREKARGYKEVG